ncbi:MAG: hypothetical protein ACI9S8_000492 [Chlamydiales bacterium]|jgi:hypothetical protein
MTSIASNPHQDLINNFPEYAAQHGLDSSIHDVAPNSPVSSNTSQSLPSVGLPKFDSISIADKGLAKMMVLLNLASQSGGKTTQNTPTQNMSKDEAYAMSQIRTASLANAFKLPTVY